MSQVYYQPIRFVFFLMFFILLFVDTSKAQVINCTGSHTSTNDSYMFYDASSQTCTVADAAPSASTGDISIHLQPTSVQYLADNDLNGTLSDTDHTGCTNRNNTIGAGGACNGVIVDGGYSSERISAAVDATTNAVLTFSITKASGPNRVSISSGTVVLTAVTASTVNTNTRQADDALQASLSRSQTNVVLRNIASHLNTISVQEKFLKSTQNNSTFGSIGQAAINTNIFSEFEKESKYEGSTLREVVSRMSFDTANNQVNLLSANLGKPDEPDLLKQRRQFSEPNDFTIWGASTFNSLENDFNNDILDSRYDGNVWGYNLGLDYRLSQKLVTGLSVGYSDADINTTYNAGNYEETSWNVSPYILYNIQKNIQLAAVAGFSIGDIDVDRQSNSIKGSTESESWYFNVDLSAQFKPIKESSLEINPSLGATFVRKTIDSYQQSDGSQVKKANSNTRQLRPGVEIAHAFDVHGTSFHPFVKAELVYDFLDEINGDKEAFDMSSGVHFSSNNSGFYGTLSAERQFGRTDFSEYSVNGFLAYNFNLDNWNGKDSTSVVPYIKTDLSVSGTQYSSGVSYLSPYLGLTVNSDVMYIPESSFSEANSQFNLNAKWNF